MPSEKTPEELLRDEIKAAMFPGSVDVVDASTPSLEQPEEPEEEAPEIPDEETPPVETPPVETPSEPTLEERYQNLLKTHNEQSAELLDLRSRGERPPVAPERPQVVAQPLPKVPMAQADVAFTLDEQTLKQALVEDDADAMKKIILGLVDFVNQKTQAQGEVFREAVLRDIPNVVAPYADSRVTLALAVRDFYRQNEDLVPHMSTVGLITNEIVNREPNLTLPAVLEKAETETRRRLGLKKVVIDQESVANRNQPAFAKTKSSRKPGAPVVSGVRAEIAAANAAIGR